MTSTNKTVAITGANGALGRYASLHFHYRRNLRVLAADRATFGSPDALRDIVTRSDVIFHLAGVNRAPDAELGSANPALANTLVAALEAAGTAPQVVYASSVHEGGDSVYGRSKRIAGNIIEEWAGRSGAKFTRLLLPHIYSELVRPNYNSGIATFCSTIAKGGRPELLVDAEITPLHATEICALFDALLDGTGDVETAPVGRPWRMSEILADISRMHELYAHRLIVPDLRETRQLHLFNTYRAHLYANAAPTRPVLHSDDRGNLFEAVRELNGGQTFISTTRPGITRGNHFHFQKVERFCVLRGNARIRMRKMDSDETLTFNISGREPSYIDMPTLWTHNVTNVGDDELLTLFWANEIFNPDASDTYFVPV